MKVLFDPLYTSRSPGKCASANKFIRLAKHILENHPDCWIYWPIPEVIQDPSDLLAFPQSDRIKYVRMSYGDDRYREYRRLYYQQEKLIAHYGEFWDWDILVTNRTTLVPLYRQMVNHHSSGSTRWSRRIYVLEDFPQMGWKVNAAIAAHYSQDSQVILGYYCADRTAISAYWEKDVIVQTARQWFSPTVIRHLQDTVMEATPIHVESTALKSLEWTRSRERPFTVGFAGRLVNDHKFERIFDVMEKAWVKPEGWKVECLLSTQSQGVGAAVRRIQIPEYVRVYKANRDQFHALMKEQVHVGVFFSREEDYSMSLIEPLILGVPYAVFRCRWTEASLGEDYPYFFGSTLECHDIVRRFYQDYEGEYAKFAEWSKKKFEPLLRERNKVSIFTEFDKEVGAWNSEFELWRKTSNYPTSSIVHLVVDEMKGANTPLTIGEALIRSEEKGKTRSVAKKLVDMDQFDLRTSFSTDRNLIRLKLLGFWGAKDKSWHPGSVQFPKDDV